MFKEKQCKMCSTKIKPTAPAQLYCALCKEKASDIQREKAKVRAERCRRARGAKIGRGALPAEKHPNYRHGYYVADTQRRKIFEERRYCERCDKDLFEVNRWGWVMHHKDHNHSNHQESNLELLCKRCHQVEHQCWKAFESATTRSQDRREEKDSSRSAQHPTDEGDDIVSSPSKGGSKG